MKKLISTVLIISLAASALSLGACSKKHVIDTDLGADGDVVSGAAGVVYETVTDKNGEKVTDAAGEAVTVAVPVEPEGTTAAGADETKKDDAAKKTDTTTKKGETTAKPTDTTKKGETATAKKTDTTTAKRSESSTSKKTETTTAKKTESTTAKKTEPTTAKKTEPTTAAPIAGATPATSVNPGEFVLSLSADKTTVKPGDTVTVTVNLNNCKSIKSFGLFIMAQGSVEAVNSRKKANIEDLTTEINTKGTNDYGEDGVLIGGYFKETGNLDNCDLYTIQYKVSDSAVSGETLLLSIESDLMVSATSSGDVDYASAIKPSPLYITVE